MIFEQPHTRLNILTGEWVLVSPQRSKRPWQGKVEAVQAGNRPHYDPGCYLCPGNTRADGSVNPAYTGAYAFTNDFSALLPDTPEAVFEEGGLLEARSEKGICRVICFSPRHDLSLAEMTTVDIRKVVDLWCTEFEQLSCLSYIRNIQIFENKGDIMGCSNPHPHGQIWAQSSLPVEMQKEDNQQCAYFNRTGRSLLADYASHERAAGVRMVFENEHFSVIVPFWAVWPFETIVISKVQRRNLLEFTASEKDALAACIGRLGQAYDRLFGISFPYSGGMHQAPVNSGPQDAWHWHMHYYPPLLRSATVKKFMVGYEMLGNPQRDITPEWAAERLKEMF